MEILIRLISALMNLPLMNKFVYNFILYLSFAHYILSIRAILFLKMSSSLLL